MVKYSIQILNLKIRVDLDRKEGIMGWGEFGKWLGFGESELVKNPKAMSSGLGGSSAIGSALGGVGPWGMAIGAVGSLVSGYFQNKDQNKQLDNAAKALETSAIASDKAVKTGISRTQGNASNILSNYAIADSSKNPNSSAGHSNMYSSNISTGLQNIFADRTAAIQSREKAWLVRAQKSSFDWFGTLLGGAVGGMATEQGINNSSSSNQLMEWQKRLAEQEYYKNKA